MKTKFEENYKFCNPCDTSGILRRLINKIGEYEFNRKKRKEEQKDWYYKISDKVVLNPALIFARLIPYAYNTEEIKGNEENNKDKFLQLVKNETEKINEEIKKREFFIFERLKSIVNNLENLGYKVLNPPIEAELKWRLVIGLGGTHPYETSMTFHHIYGIPYIPASAVKGVTRHWVIQEYFEGKEKEALEKDEDFKKIFGTQEEQGKVIFFDAYPVGDIHLAIDIMNPHYPDYYEGREFPTDWQNPRPIKFLTVENTKFQFLLASKEKELLEKAKNWLEDALKESGIGAKTSLGYGIFE